METINHQSSPINHQSPIIWSHLGVEAIGNDGDRERAQWVGVHRMAVGERVIGGDLPEDEGIVNE